MGQPNNAIKVDFNFKRKALLSGAKASVMGRYRLFSCVFVAACALVSPTMAATNGASTGDIINHLADKVSNGLDKVSALVASKAPVAWDILCNITRFQGIFHLIIGLLCLIALFPVYKIGIWIKDTIVKACDEDYGMLFIPLIVVAVPICAGVIINLLDINNWLMAVYPQGYIIYHTLNKFF